MSSPQVAAPLQGDPQAPPDGIAAEDAVVALLAAYVAGQTAAAAARTGLTPVRLVAALARIGIPRRVARLTLRLSLSVGIRVQTRTPRGGPASRAVARAEPIWRARYLVNAAKRMTRAYLNPPRVPGQRTPTVPPSSVPLLPGMPSAPTQWEPQVKTRDDALRDAFDAERRHLEAHRAAQLRRAAAAAAVDVAAHRYGAVLGWYGTHDAATTWDCARLIGTNFAVDQPPAGHYPSSVHRYCRCHAGPPHPGARIVGRSGV